MKGILIGNGSNIDYSASREEILKGDIVIAIDGGIYHCLKMDIIPDLLIGDLDSIDEEGFEYIEDKEVDIMRYPSEKDFTDMELGIEYLKDEGCRYITIFGGTGTRLDHTLGNIFLLDYIKGKDMVGKIVDDHNIIYLVDDEMVLSKMENRFVSIIPIEDDGAIVSLKGFKYELDRRHVLFSSTLGVSNEIVQEKGYINIYRGRVLVFISKD